MQSPTRQQAVLDAIPRRLAELEHLSGKLRPEGKLVFNRDVAEIVGWATFFELEKMVDGWVWQSYQSLMGESPSKSDSTAFSRAVKALDQKGLIERTRGDGGQRFIRIARTKDNEQ